MSSENEDAPPSPAPAAASAAGDSPRIEKSWLEKHEQLRQYKLKNGDTLVHSKLPLGGWCNLQRFRHKSGKLDGEKFRLLDELGFHWGSLRSKNKKSADDGGGGEVRQQQQQQQRPQSSVSQSEINWQEQYQALRNYRDANGGLKGISKSYVGGWVKRQRAKYKSGGLPEDKARLLTELGVDLDRNLDRTAPRQAGEGAASAAAAATEEGGRGGSSEWRAMYEKLRSYKLRNGDCLVPLSYHRDPALGQWVAEQRVRVKDRLEGRLSDSPLTYEMFADLDVLGFRFVL